MKKTNVEEKNVFNHFAGKGQIEVCSILPIFACFQAPQNNRHQTNLDQTF